MNVSIELRVLNDHTIFLHASWQNLNQAINALEQAGFRVVPAGGSAEPAEVIVAIEMSAGGFVREGGETPPKKRHPQSYYLPGASLEKTKETIEFLVHGKG